MSSCLILQDKNNFYIGADTACSINIDGKFYRYSNDVQKIFTHGDDVYFCSGDMDVVCLIVTWISKHFFNQPSIDVIQLSNFLKKKYPFDNQDFFDIEIVICRKESNTTKVFQLSQYNNYTLITHTAQENGVNLLCCGYKTQDLYNSTYSMISQGCVDSKKLYKNIFNTICDNKVGGNLILYKNNKEILNEKIQESNIEYFDDIIKRKHLLIAEAVIAGYIEGSKIKGGTIQIGEQSDGTYAFEVHKDGSVTMNGGGHSIYGYATNTEVKKVEEQVASIEKSKMYRVETVVDGSTIITTEEQSTTLTCKVYSWDTDITDTLDASKFSWKRKSTGGAITAEEIAMIEAQDANWNHSQEHQGKKTITITADDILENSSFICVVELPDLAETNKEETNGGTEGI